MSDEKRKSVVEDKLLSVDKVADIFDVSPWTIRQWLNSATPGSLEGTKVNGRWKVRESEVNRLAEEKYGVNKSHR